MSQVSRRELEIRQSVRSAAAIVHSFLYDTESYPDAEFYTREPRILKTLAEEYSPLVRLALALRCVRGIRLFPESNEGPDGQILFWHKPSWKLQITCSHEGYDRALMREQMANGELVGSGIRFRDKATGDVVYEPAVFAPDEDVRARVERIHAMVRKKEQKYRAGTDTLIVLDEPDESSHLQEGQLRVRVSQTIRDDGPSRYVRIYIVYGQVPVRVG